MAVTIQRLFVYPQLVTAAPDVPAINTPSAVYSDGFDIDCDPVAGATLYRWRIDGVEVQAGASTTLLARSLSPDTAYDVDVRAENGAGNSAYSAVVTVTTEETGTGPDPGTDPTAFTTGFSRGFH